MREGWELKKLGDVGECRIGLTYSPDDVCAEGGTLVLRSSNVQNGRIAYKDNVLVQRDVPQNAMVSAGDILICVRNGSRSLIGKSAMISSADEGRAFGAFMATFRSRYGEYIFQLLQTDDFKRQVHRTLGATINQITNSDLKSFTFPFPPIAEQRKIAKVLMAWDRAAKHIEAQVSLHEKLYIGLREKLIDWSSKEDQKLGRLVKSVSRPVPKPTEPYSAISVRSHGKGSYARRVDDPSKVSMDTLYRVKTGDLVINITFAWEGAIAIITEEQDGFLVSHRFPCFEIDTRFVDPRFLRHALRMSRFKYLLGVISPGGAGRNRVLNKSDLLQLGVPCPPLERQNEIAQILDDAESSIAASHNYYSTVMDQKRGLMQKLLTGEWRVEVSDDEEAAA